MGFRFCPLASGSSGNSIFVGSDQTYLLVDAGISCKKITEGLILRGIDPTRIGAVLLTHDHSDHIGGITVFAKKYNIKIYGSEGTLDTVYYNAVGAISKERMFVVKPDTEFMIGDITVRPFSVSHDASEPLAYCFLHDGKKLGMATDLGEYTDYTVANLSDSDSLYLEANHDKNMLLMGPYPYSLKKRVGSALGHLSNDACGELVCKLHSDRLRRIVLAHISLENNFEELAYETVRYALESAGFSADATKIMVANRYEPMEVMDI